MVRTSSGKLIPLIINNALQGKKLPVYGDGKNVRDWLYVMDHAKGIDMVQEKAAFLKPTISADIMKTEYPDHSHYSGYSERDASGRRFQKRACQRKPDHLCRGPQGPWPSLCDRSWQDQGRGWLVSGNLFWGWNPPHDQMVFENEDWMKNVTSGDYQKYYNDMYQTK